MRFLYYSALCVLSCVSVSSVSAVCTGDKTPTGGSGGDVPLKGGTPSANAIPLFYTFGANSGAFTNGIKNGGLGGLEGADFFCNYEADAARGATSLLQARKNLFKAIMSNRLTDAHERFNSVNDFTNGGIIHDVVDSNNACLVDSVGSLIVSGWNFNQVLPDGKGALADAAATIESFTGTLTDWTRAVVPTGSEDAAANTVVNNAYCSASTSSTDKGWSSTTGTTKVGRMFNAINDVPGHWISATDSGCSNGLHILCLQAQPTPTSGGSGDPQFTGLQGQQYQVHGMPDEYFNLISSPDMQLNSRFAYLASGRCNYNNTECWTHPGTYVDQLGFMFPGLTIKAIAGTHDDGMTLYINDKHIIPSSTSETTHHTIHSHHHHHQDMNSTQIISITYSQHDKLIVQAPLFTITATNSDMFFNFGVSLHSPWLLSAGSALHHINDKSGSSLYPSFPLHGLLGQSWKNARYQHGRMFAGTVDDYMLLDSKLMSTKFIYNQYKH